MNISNKKSHFFQDSVEYLGDVIRNNKITIYPGKIQTIKEVSQVIIELIRNFADIVKPLNTFSEETTVTYQRIKEQK